MKFDYDSVELARKIKNRLSKECGYSTKKVLEKSQKTIKKLNIHCVYPRHLRKKAA